MAEAAAALKEEGNASFKAGQYGAAIDAYTRSLEQDPTQHLCLSNRSAAYLKLGGAAELALNDAKKCVELAPTFTKGYSRQAAALQELKRWDEAVAVCEAGLSAAPPDEALRKMLKEVRMRQFQDKLQGAWHGTVSQELGGYDQEMEFLEAGKVRIEVLGRSILGSYWLECGHDPHHLSIQVPMPDAPPGMPPPPPVPYIVRIDDKGLHLCCPFMVMERPTAFEGPGYCCMTKGKLGRDDAADETSRMTEDEKLLMCVKELTAALPNSKLEEPKQTDSEEVTREKLMTQVRFESSMFAVQKKFGEENMKKVLSAAKGDAALPECLSRTPELKQLLEKLTVCGLLGDEEAAQPAAAESRPAAPAAVPASGRSEQASEAAGGAGLDMVLAGALVAGAAAIAAGVLLWQRRRR